MNVARRRTPGGLDPGPQAAVGRGLVLSVSLGTVLNPVNSSMLAVALVPIAHAFGTSVTAASWLVSALYITTAVAQPTWGRIADSGAPRRVFLTGACLVALAGALAPFAPNLAFLIGVRILLGIGTASAYPSALAIVRRAAEQGGGQVPTAALGTLSFAAQVTNACGPALGGLLLLLGGWKWVFLFNLPFVAVTFALARRYVPLDRPRPGEATRAKLSLRALDPLGMALFAGATGLGVAALLNVRADPILLAALAFGSIGSGVAFLRWERMTATPFIPLSLFQGDSRLLATYARVALTNTVFYAVYYGWPIWLERGRGLSPSTTGLVTLPIAAVGAVAAMGGTRLTRGRGPRRVLIIGSAMLLAGSLSLIGLTAATPIPVLVAVALVLGIPNGFTSVGNQLATYQQAPASLAGVAAGLSRTSSYIGANVASALVGITVATGGSDSSHNASLHLMAGVLAAVSVSLLLSAIVSRALSEAAVVSEPTGRGSGRQPVAPPAPVTAGAAKDEP